MTKRGDVMHISAHNQKRKRRFANRGLDDHVHEGAPRQTCVAPEAGLPAQALLLCFYLSFKNPALRCREHSAKMLTMSRREVP